MKTLDEIKADLSYRGKSIAEWARANGYNPRTVYAVIYGQVKGSRGVSHDIAVKLGLKDGVPRDAA